MLVVIYHFNKAILKKCFRIKNTNIIFLNKFFKRTIIRIFKMIFSIVIYAVVFDILISSILVC